MVQTTEVLENEKPKLKEEKTEEKVLEKNNNEDEKDGLSISSDEGQKK